MKYPTYRDHQELIEEQKKNPTEDIIGKMTMIICHAIFHRAIYMVVLILGSSKLYMKKKNLIYVVPLDKNPDSERIIQIFRVELIVKYQMQEKNTQSLRWNQKLKIAPRRKNNFRKERLGQSPEQKK